MALFETTVSSAGGSRPASMLAVFALAALLTCLIPLPAWADDGLLMHRLYNPNSGEHFYTASAAERDNVVSAGWRYEGVGWTAPESGDPVYRMYNANGGEHHYTLSAEERDALVAAGWAYEGVGWRSAPAETGAPLYREYNPNAFACNHNYTASLEEHENLGVFGWRDEGVSWYGIAASKREVDEGAALRAYNAKLQELVSAYGEPGLASGRQGRYGTGVVYAQLLDFGDECDSLVVSYYDSSKNTSTFPSGSGLDCYPVEVWTYDSDAGGIRLVHRGSAQLEGQNYYCSAIEVTRYCGRYCVYEQTSGGAFPAYSAFTRLYGIREDGSYGLVRELESSGGYYGGAVSRRVDGISVSQAVSEAAQSQARTGLEISYPATLTSSNRDVNATLNQARATIAALAEVG